MRSRNIIGEIADTAGFRREEEKRVFKTRLLSGIILVAVLLALGILGGDVLLAGLCIVSEVGLFELYRVCKIEKSGLGIIGYVLVVAYYFGIKLAGMGISREVVIFSLAMALLIAVMAVYVFTYPKYHASQVMAAFFGFFYVAVMLSCIYLTRMLVGGNYYIWLIFLCSWGCDTCAYCVGMLLGKHKMAPILSPKKSVEGAVGGVVGAALLTVLYGFVFQKNMGLTVSEIWVMAAISAAGALVSMVGDLAASAIKRNYEIKDYGKLIPGHGGILDRFDSVIFTAPLIFFLVCYL